MPLFIDGSGNPVDVNAYSWVADLNGEAFIQFIAGASATFTPIFPIKVESLRLTTHAVISGNVYHALQYTIHYDDGTVDVKKVLPYSDIYYAQDVFADKYVQKVVVEPVIDPAVAVTVRLNTATGRVVPYNAVGAKSFTPVLGFNNAIMYELGNLPIFAPSNIDVSNEWSVSTVAPTAAAGFSAAGLLDGSSTYKASTFAAGSLTLTPINPINTRVPYRVELDVEASDTWLKYLSNVGVLTATSAGVTYANNVKHTRPEVGYAPASGAVTTLSLLVYPNNSQANAMVNAITISLGKSATTTSTGNITIKRIRVYSI